MAPQYIKSDMTSAPPKSSRRTIVLVLFLFAAPLLIAFAVYYGSDWRPSGATNKGELINPAIPLPSVALTGVDTKPVSADFLHKVWTLVYVGDGACDDACRKALANMHLVRQLLGKDMGRTASALLFTGTCCDAALLTVEPALQSARVDDAAGKTLLAAFPAINAQSPLAGKRIYLVDPLGNLMMSYKPGTDPRDIYLDLKKLLELSHIG